MIKTSGVSLLVVFMVITLGATAQKMNKTNIPFDFDWRFALNDQPGAEQPGFDDFKWRLPDVPHDFSIEHSFEARWDSE